MSEENSQCVTNIKQLLKDRDAVIIAHYYVNSEIQKLAEETGGFVGDSLEMAKFGARHPAKTLIIAGVRFMGETAKILNPEKKVLVPTAEADCSLDISCQPDEFAEFCKNNKGRTVVVYMNTSAAIKALADKAGGVNERARGGTKVLIVEDDKFLRDLIVQKLKREGFVTSEAVDGEEGLKITKEN